MMVTVDTHLAATPTVAVCDTCGEPLAEHLTVAVVHHGEPDELIGLACPHPTIDTVDLR